MHKISRQEIKKIAEQLAKASAAETTQQLLEKVRELYEKITLLHYTSKQKNEEEKTLVVNNPSEKKSIDFGNNTKEQEKAASVEERIKNIMEDASRRSSESSNVPPKTSGAHTTGVENATKESISKETHKPEEKTPTTSLEEELKNAISADFAADLFENAAKIETAKKSLNDSLSQNQILIGLNDRIAFVKHLFAGRQTDYNRIISQLNSFETEAQAKFFIESVVKPDYNWGEKTEYVERLMHLIEKRYI